MSDAAPPTSPGFSKAPASTPRLTFRKAQRLVHARQFEAVYAAKCSRTFGAIRIHACLNGMTPPITRLGLSIGRRAGGAVQRNALKRLIREAFRLEQHGLPKGVDIVVAAGGKAEVTLEALRARLVTTAAELAERLHTRRSNP